MAKRTLILSQKQLDEIVGGNGAYLDNAGEDFAENGNNEVFANGKLSGHDGEPITTDKLAHELVNNNGFTGYGSHGRDFSRSPIYFYESTKKNWAKKNLSEEYNDPTMTASTYTTGNKNADGTTKQRNLGSMKMEKTRYRAAQAKANSTDPSERKQGMSTMKTMEKNDPNISNEINQYDNRQKMAANIRQTDKDILGKPILNKTASPANASKGDMNTGKVIWDSDDNLKI